MKKPQAGRPCKPHLIVQLRMAAPVAHKLEAWRSAQFKKTGTIPTRTQAIEVLIIKGILSDAVA